jgi:hypothetical protein
VAFLFARVSLGTRDKVRRIAVGRQEISVIEGTSGRGMRIIYCVSFIDIDNDNDTKVLEIARGAGGNKCSAMDVVRRCSPVSHSVVAAVNRF